MIVQLLNKLILVNHIHNLFPFFFLSFFISKEFHLLNQMHHFLHHFHHKEHQLIALKKFFVKADALWQVWLIHIGKINNTLNFEGEKNKDYSLHLFLFRYYLLVSVFKYIVAVIMVLEYSYLSGLMVLEMNYAVSIPFLIAIAFNKPLDKLTERSNSNMLSNLFTFYLKQSHFFFLKILEISFVFMGKS